MNNAQPQVSIVIPCYNNEVCVAGAIESALQQTYDPVEVIVVNDGSTDNSGEVIASYEDRIGHIKTENHGACHARNVGLHHATGAYVKFLDADDTLYPEAIEQQVEQSAALSGSQRTVFGDAKHVKPDGSVSRETDFSNGECENRILHILKMNLQTSLPLHNRFHLEAVGGFDETLPRAQEYDLHFRLAADGVQFTYRPAQIVRVLEHEGADRISNQDHFSSHPRGRLGRIRKRARIAEEQGLLDASLRTHLARASWHAGRMAVRRGFSSVADDYFDLAQSLHRKHIASTSDAYRWAVRWLGPHVAEWLVQQVRSVHALRLK